MPRKMNDRSNLWKSLVGGGNNGFSSGGSNDDFGEELWGGGNNNKVSRSSKRSKKPCGQRKHHRKNDNDTCEKIRFKERIRQKVIVKIMKPICVGGLCQGDESDETCEVETFCAHYDIPVVAKILRAECASSCRQ